MAPRSVWLFGCLTTLVCLLGCKRAPNPEPSAQKVSELQKVGDPCTKGLRCSGRKSAVGCVGGVVKPLECRGPDGCTPSADRVVCDNALALTGDACDEEHDFACALDRKAGLECQAGVFKVVDAYSGIQGCTLKGDDITCDKSLNMCDDIEDLSCCLTFARLPKFVERE